jgi:uncharacterized protein
VPVSGSDPLTGLDLRAPLVLDTRELGRRPGSRLQVARTVPAPADLGIDVLRAVEGSPIVLDLRLEAVVEGVLVTGSAEVGLEGECVRCLGEVRDEVVAPFQDLFVYTDQNRRGGDDPGDDDVRKLEGELLDLEPLLRDAVVLELPFQPLCADDCPGLCADCGARLVDDPGHTHGDTTDPRWAGLAALLRDDD